MGKDKKTKRKNATFIKKPYLPPDKKTIQEARKKFFEELEEEHLLEDSKDPKKEYLDVETFAIYKKTKENEYEIYKRKPDNELFLAIQKIKLLHDIIENISLFTEYQEEALSIKFSRKRYFLKEIFKPPMSVEKANLINHELHEKIKDFIKSKAFNKIIETNPLASEIIPYFRNDLSKLKRILGPSRKNKIKENEKINYSAISDVGFIQNVFNKQENSKEAINKNPYIFYSPYASEDNDDLFENFLQMN